jgi:uncharacterized protein YdaU (DUF1376 family)
MPLYIGDYLRKTMHLTIDQHGAYLMLIMACWCGGGSLPNDDKILSGTCRVTEKKWREKLRPRMERFFVIDDAGWHNRRVDEELAKAKDITATRRAAGQAGGLAKGKQTGSKTDSKIEANAIAKGKQNASKQVAIAKQNPTPSPKKEEEYNLNTLPSESVAAREEGEGFKKIDNGFSRARSARSPQLDHLVQKLIRFVNATMADPERSVTVAGLCGADEKLGEQWWLDHVDKLMKAQHWDDTERLSA